MQPEISFFGDHGGRSKKSHSRASERNKRSLNRYDTKPNRVMKPPSVAQTILKLVTARVGMAREKQVEGGGLVLANAGAVNEGDEAHCGR